jgi:hypothetical protein
VTINVREWQGDVISSPGQKYEHTMVHRFSVQ